MSFSQALEALKEGKYVSRKGWNGKFMYLFLIGTDSSQPGIGGWTFTNGKNDNYALSPFIAMKTADDKIVPWLASQTDILADDWGVVEYWEDVTVEGRGIYGTHNGEPVAGEIIENSPSLPSFIEMCERANQVKEELGN